jgi:hypothetical protein
MRLRVRCKAHGGCSENKKRHGFPSAAGGRNQNLECGSLLPPSGHNSSLCKSEITKAQASLRSKGFALDKNYAALGNPDAGPIEQQAMYFGENRICGQKPLFETKCAYRCDPCAISMTPKL